MTALVPLETAKRHLRITGTTEDADIQRKLNQAQDAIVRYLAEYADDAWTETTAPLVVTAAIERYLAYLYQARGDDPTGKQTDRDVWESIRELLMSIRPPTLGTGVAPVVTPL